MKMKSQNNFLNVVSSLTSDEMSKAKYAEHLAELFDVIDPTVYGNDFSNAVECGNYEEAISILAAYYRKKPYFTLPELSAEMPYDYEEAIRAARGHAREINIDWKFPNGEIDFYFDPTLIKGPRNHEWLWQFNRHNYWQNMARAYVGEKDEEIALAFRHQLLTWIKDTYVPTDINNQKDNYNYHYIKRLHIVLQHAYQRMIRTDTILKSQTLKKIILQISKLNVSIKTH